jgi:hypothetical protein
LSIHLSTTCCVNFTFVKLENKFCCLSLCVRSPYVFVNSPYIRCDAFYVTSKSKYSQNYRFTFFGLWLKYCDMKIENMSIVFYKLSQTRLKIHCHGIPNVGMWLNGCGVQLTLKQGRHHSLIFLCFLFSCTS